MVDELKQWYPNVGDHTYAGKGFIIHGGEGCTKRVTIGKYCSIGPDLQILTGGGHDYRKVSTYPFQYLEGYSQECKDWAPFEVNKTVEIGNDVWIGLGVKIMGGIKIGDGAVIGMGAVVVRNIEPFEVVGGVPAKHIKWRFNTSIRQGLGRIKWWDWSDEILKSRLKDMDNPKRFVELYG